MSIPPEMIPVLMEQVFSLTGKLAPYVIKIFEADSIPAMVNAKGEAVKNLVDMINEIDFDGKFDAMMSAGDNAIAEALARREATG